MVKASITEFGFDVSGHANFEVHGYDIVCAGISSLAQTVAESLKKHCKAKVQATNGWMVVDIEEPTEDSKILLDTLRIGLQKIEEVYPNHLQVRIKRGVF